VGALAEQAMARATESGAEASASAATVVTVPVEWDAKSAFTGADETLLEVGLRYRCVVLGPVTPSPSPESSPSVCVTAFTHPMPTCYYLLIFSATELTPLHKDI
jgi:hypothetical protein